MFAYKVTNFLPIFLFFNPLNINEWLMIWGVLRFCLLFGHFLDVRGV